MASTYSKPFLPFADQLSLLENRGLTVEDRDAALHHLQTVGYYTLGGYLYPMREIVTVAGEQTRSDQFRAGASFKHVIDLYNFDQQLRLLCLEALERIERVVKVQVAYQSGLRDPFAHDTGSLHSRDRLAVKPGEALSAHQRWNNTHNSKVTQRASAAIRTFIEKYGTPMPIWVAVDPMDFGDVSHLVSLFSKKHQIRLAREFGIHRGVDFVSWVRSMNHVRNISAHHDRLWNRELVDVPTMPKGPEASYFCELMTTPKLWSRTYAALLVISFFLDQITPRTDWSLRMGQLLLDLPEGCGVNYAALGAPDEWLENPAWGLV